MAIHKYSKYKILVDPQSKHVQGLRIGDVIKRQYFDAPNLIYSLMIVLEAGIDLIAGNNTPYFIAALLEGDGPQNGEVLDFVRTTSLCDLERSGALYLTASDAEAPFLDVIDTLSSEIAYCFPCMDGGDVRDYNKFLYNCKGRKFLNVSYIQSTNEANRVLRIVRNKLTNLNESIGFRQMTGTVRPHPERIVISFRIRASKNMSSVPLTVGYTVGTNLDGETSFDITTEWLYKVFVISIEHPPHFSRCMDIALETFLTMEGDWCELADLSILSYSDIANYADKTKVRVGKVKGITDPVFGVLDGYGAYFQNLYATKNVNIAGTLTAGDANGFSSTFYVGKIHKNAIENSIQCRFNNKNSILANKISPTGIGSVWNLGASSLICQSGTWRDKHLGEKYSFSFWAQSLSNAVLSVYQENELIGKVQLGANWLRYNFSFIIRESASEHFAIRFELSSTDVFFSSPQLEAGEYLSQYQPTDGTLAYVEDYGAWFSRGGIGGTIQNPLLKLNEDGSISSINNSFVINPDGTGHFASGRFTWNKDTITLKDITIRWEDFSAETQDNMSPIILNIVSKQGFITKNLSSDVDATAILYRNGKELDSNGTLYTYTWKLWKTTGTLPTKTYKGKTILVAKSDIADKLVLTCDVEE